MREGREGPPLPEGTITRARAWADRAPTVDEAEAVRRLRGAERAESNAYRARRWAWILLGAAATVLLALVARQRTPPEPALPRAVEGRTAHPQPVAASRLVVVELSSGTRLYVALRGS